MQPQPQIYVTSMYGTTPMALAEAIPNDGVSVLVLADMLTRQLRVGRVRLYTLSRRKLRPTTFLRPPAAVRYRIVHEFQHNGVRHGATKPAKAVPSAYAAYAALFGDHVADDVIDDDEISDAHVQQVEDVGTGAVAQVLVQRIACEHGCAIVGATCRGKLAVKHIEVFGSVAEETASAAHMMAAAALRHAIRVAPTCSRFELLTSAPELTRQSVRSHTACRGLLGFTELVPHTCAVTHVSVTDPAASAVRRAALCAHRQRRRYHDVCETTVLGTVVALHTVAHALTQALLLLPLAWWA
jgi:hypothetical protein